MLAPTRRPPSVYLDNYDEMNKVDRRLAETLKGTPSAWTLAVRETYQKLGLPRHPKKEVTQEIKAEVPSRTLMAVTAYLLLSSCKLSLTPQSLLYDTTVHLSLIHI